MYFVVLWLTSMVVDASAADFIAADSVYSRRDERAIYGHTCDVFALLHVILRVKASRGDVIFEWVEN